MRNTSDHIHKLKNLLFCSGSFIYKIRIYYKLDQRRQRFYYYLFKLSTLVKARKSRITRKIHDDDHGTFAVTYQLGKCYLRWEIYNAKAKITRVVKYIITFTRVSRVRNRC